MSRPGRTAAGVTVRLERIHWQGSQLFLLYSADGLLFSNTLWYEGLDLPALERRIGSAAWRNVCFHIAAFELNKLCSLKARRVEWGDYADLATPAFCELWSTVFHHVWAQWRFENDLPHHPPPAVEPAAGAPASAPEPVSRQLEQERYLCFCGGGKDSLLAAKLLEVAGVAFDSLTYAASYYGTLDAQHELAARLAPYIAPRRHLRQWLFDDFLDSPVLKLSNPHGVGTLAAAETPSSIFGALPFVLEGGYSHIALAHERSADRGQLRWEATGEEVNHQWGKSQTAERLINRYLSRHLVSGVDYFSVLNPLYDLAIFHALRRWPEAVEHTHSCNVAKPWCLRCAKCLYVWVGYAAFLEPDVVARTFGPANPLADADNVHTYRQLVGLEAQLPFECIGEAPEAALMLAMAERRGYRGPAVSACREALDALNVAEVLDTYLTVADEAAALVPGLRQRLAPWMADNAAEARRFVRGTLAATEA